MANRYSRKSASELATCHPDLRRLFEAVLPRYDHAIIEGRRTEERQRQMVAQGKSRTMASKHLANADGWSEAVDVAPWPIDWENTKAFYHFAGYVLGVAHSLGIKIRCGCDWDSDLNFEDQTFQDLVHFELVH